MFLSCLFLSSFIRPPDSLDALFASSFFLFLYGGQVLHAVLQKPAQVSVITAIAAQAVQAPGVAVAEKTTWTTTANTVHADAGMVQEFCSFYLVMCIFQVLVLGVVYSVLSGFRQF